MNTSYGIEWLKKQIYTYTHMPIYGVSQKGDGWDHEEFKLSTPQALEELEKANEEERTKLEAAVKEKFNPSWAEWEHQGTWIGDL